MKRRIGPGATVLLLIAGVQATSAGTASRSLLGVPGTTTLLVGQTYVGEYDAYRHAFGVPAGSSHYGEIYSDRINQGDDGDPARPLRLLDFVDSVQDSAIVEVAMSWKDNPDLSRHPRDACGDFVGKRVYQVNQDIASGMYDAQIDSLGAVFAHRPATTFLLRIEYEVSRFAFSWKPSASCPASGVAYDFTDASIIDNAPYRAAFRHVATRLRDTLRLPNVRFVFHPVRGFGDAHDLYPGNDVVDFVALSLFDDDICFGGHNCGGSIDGNVRQVFQWARDSVHKPRMIAESSWQPLNNDTAWRRAQGATDSGRVDWLSRLRAVVDTFDVAVWTYIDSDWRSHGWDSTWWGDSRVESRSATSDWWKRHVVQDSRFLLGRSHAGTTGVSGSRSEGVGSFVREGSELCLRGWGISPHWTLLDARGSVRARGTGDRLSLPEPGSGASFLRVNGRFAAAVLP
jgi:hypothetical protein